MSRTAPTAFLALWNSIKSAALQPEYETWHTFEHVPERVGLPGFVEARRYRSLAHSPTPPTPQRPPDYFTCYWLDTIEALNSTQYHEVFARPTPWSARMRLELSDFFRLPCTLGGAYGQSMASQLATLHLRGEAGAFAAQASRELARRVEHGELVGAHWGRVTATEEIPIANQPTAQELPGSDSGSDFVVMLQGLDPDALRAQAQLLLQALQPAAHPVSPPAFFELLSQVRQDELDSAAFSPKGAGRRQPPRPDLFQKFQTGDKP